MKNLVMSEAKNDMIMSKVERYLGHQATSGKRHAHAIVMNHSDAGAET